MVKEFTVILALSITVGAYSQIPSIEGKYICKCELSTTMGIRDFKYELVLYKGGRYKLKSSKFNRVRGFYDKGELLDYSLEIGNWKVDSLTLNLSTQDRKLPISFKGKSPQLKGIDQCRGEVFYRKKKFRRKPKL